MKAYPIVGIPRLDEALAYLEARTGEKLSLLNLFRLAHAGELQLVLFMNSAASDSFYSSSCFKKADILNCSENEDFFDSVEDEYLSDDGLSENELEIKWAFKDRPLDIQPEFLPKLVCSGGRKHSRLTIYEELTPKRIIEFGLFEDRFGVTSESLNNLIAKSQQSTPESRTSKLSTQGENSYKKSCRALAQALIGTISDSPTPQDIRNIEKELADRGVENPHSQKTWLKHLSNPD